MAMSEAQKAAKREYERQYREKNREKLREYQAKWRAENPDKIKKNKEAYWERKAQQLAEKQGKEENNG